MNPPNFRKHSALHDPMCRNCVYLARHHTCTKSQIQVKMDSACMSWESIFLKEDGQVVSREFSWERA